LFSGRRWNVERTAVFIFKDYVDRVARVCLLPIDLQEPCDRERLRLWTNFVPPTPKKKEEALANLGAIREEDLSLHALGQKRLSMLNG